MSTRFTVVYGASGVGKSSLLRAGVIHDLREQARRDIEQLGCAEFAVVYVSDWSGDPLSAISVALQQGIAATLGTTNIGLPLTVEDLTSSLRSWCERINGELFLILDQFEEYFLYHPDHGARSAFDEALVKAINDRTLPVNFLVSLRDDALSQLDRFKGRIPELFSNYLRVRRLDRESARSAIEEPINYLNQGLDSAEPRYAIEAELVDAVLSQVEAGRVGFEIEPGGTPSERASSESSIEAPYLQLVLDRLWQEETTQGSRVLRASTLAQLDGADSIVRTHLDVVMDRLSDEQREPAIEIFHHLVTPSLTKIAHTVADLAHYGEVSEEEIVPVLERLCSSDARVLRPVVYPDRPEDTRYEIYHDVLARAVLDWRRRYRQTKAEQRAASAEVARQRAESRRFEAEVARIEAQAVSLKPLAWLLIASPILLFLVYGWLSYRLAERTDPVYAELVQLQIPFQVDSIRPPVDPPKLRPNPDLQILKEKLAPEIDRGTLAIFEDDARTVIRLEGSLFASGSASPSATLRAVALRITTALNDTRGAILVVGHVDNVPIRTVRFPSNWHLSQARAEAVAGLIAAALSDPGRVKAEGRSDSEPIADNATRQGRARNRRVEIMLSHEEYQP